jgi:hypothetical protein
MGRLLSAVIAVAVLLGLGGLAVLASPVGSMPLALVPVAAAAQSEIAAAPAAPAAGPKYNTIALPLDSGITLASQLFADINNTTTSTALQLLKWDPAAGFITYDPLYPFSEDFPLAVGDPVLVLLQGTGASDVYSMVGDVPPPNSVHFSLIGDTATCQYNFISVPLDKGNITTASELAASIGGVTSALKWDPDQGYIIYDPTYPFSTDFDVKIGYPYFVCMTATKTWP